MKELIIFSKDQRQDTESFHCDQNSKGLVYNALKYRDVFLKNLVEV